MEKVKEIVRTGRRRRKQERPPGLIAQAGEQAIQRYAEFFTVRIGNAGTRTTFEWAIGKFVTWCEASAIGLHEITPATVAAYVAGFPGAKPTIVMHLAAIRSLFDWLTKGGVLRSNPAESIRGPKYSYRRRKAPNLTAAEVRHLLCSIETTTIIGLRDLALIGVMVYCFLGVEALIGLRVGDYAQKGNERWLRLRNNGSGPSTIPIDHRAAAYLTAYLKRARIAGDREGPLFRYVAGGERVGRRPMTAYGVVQAVNARLKAAGFPRPSGCRTLRSTGIILYLQSGGTIKEVQKITGLKPKTLRRYRQLLGVNGRPDS